MTDSTNTMNPRGAPPGRCFPQHRTGGYSYVENPLPPRRPGRYRRRSRKDSEKRQRAAVASYAKGAGFDVVDWFNDPAVSGADPIETRPGFSALLDRIEGNGVRTVIVEDASRFARDLVLLDAGADLDNVML